MKTPTLLDKVRDALATKAPKEIASIAVAVDVTAENVRQIRDGRTDPRFGTVQAIAEHLQLFEADPRKERRAKPSAAPATA